MNIIFAFKRLVYKITRSDVFYVNGPAVLPPPLAFDEEAKLIARAEDGDAAARDELIVHNLRLVVYIGRKYDATGANLEDLVSIGTIGLIKAVSTFRLEKNIKLATYASRCIENEILMYMRKTKQMKGDVSIDEPLNIDADGNELLLSDILGSDSDTIGREIENKDEQRLIGKLVERLNPREKAIMEMRFGMNGCAEHTQKEVADHMGISQSYISRLEKRIINRLKRDLEKV